MSEENKVVEPQNQTEKKLLNHKRKPKEMVFNQEKLDNIIKQRLEAEKKKMREN